MRPLPLKLPSNAALPVMLNAPLSPANAANFSIITSLPLTSTSKSTSVISKSRQPRCFILPATVSAVSPFTPVCPLIAKRPSSAMVSCGRSGSTKSLMPSAFSTAKISPLLILYSPSRRRCPLARSTPASSSITRLSTTVNGRRKSASFSPFSASSFAVSSPLPCMFSKSAKSISQSSTAVFSSTVSASPSTSTSRSVTSSPPASLTGSGSPPSSASADNAICPLPLNLVFSSSFSQIRFSPSTSPAKFWMGAYAAAKSANSVKANLSVFNASCPCALVSTTPAIFNSSLP